MERKDLNRRGLAHQEPAKWAWVIFIALLLLLVFIS